MSNCVIVAEISSNHNLIFDRAVDLVKGAARVGVDAVKFQAYTPESMTIDVNNEYFQIKHSNWRGQTLYNLYKKSYTPLEWIKPLKKIVEDLGMLFLCTSFDKKSVDLLEDLNITAHKISSFELVDLPLIEYVSQTKKPLILSTGMATLIEITEAVAVIRANGVSDLTLLKCTSAYPADPGDINLRTIVSLKEIFQCNVGLSDHTIGIAVPIAAIVFGVSMIEKHFIISREYKSSDSFFSINEGEMKQLVKNINIVENAIGSVCYSPSEEERKNTVFRRSLFSIKDIREGEMITELNIGVIRPGHGLAPKFLNLVLGKCAIKNISRGTPITLDLLELR